MPRKRKLSNLADRCRFCLARDACVSDLFVDWIRPKLEDLQKLSGLQIIEKANYPRKICYVCLYKLEMWNEFKGQFLKTNKTLITHFKIVEETLPEVNKSLDTAQDTADELLSDDHKKRPKIDSATIISENDIVDSTLKTPEKEKSTKTDNNTIEISDVEENALSSVGKSQLSDNSASNHRRGRSKKSEREASTKRWEERKNALIAATGELPSESESDNGSQLSPVQKARVKARNIEMEYEKQKKLQKALKNLQTDLTEKYKVSYEDLVTTQERKTRSQQESSVNSERRTRSRESKPNIDEICIVENVKVNLLKSPLAEKKLGMMNVIKKEKVKEQRKVDTIELENDAVIDITDVVNDQSKEVHVIDKKSKKGQIEEIKKESVNKPEIESLDNKEPEPLKKLQKVVTNKVTKKEVNNDIDVIDLDDIEDQVNTSVSQNMENDTPFSPQELKSEVTLGNATYVVTTILDLPGSPEEKGDISLKTNGLNTDTTSQDGKIDIMNAVELQKVQSKGDPKEENKTGQDVHQCLKIEIEGMEAQALQRVQLDLAHFVTDEIQQILTDGESAKNKTNKPNKHKDSYETLNHQLKAIVKKVLRSNFETDKLVSSSTINLRNFTPEFLRAAAHSPVFQPQVVLQRLNLGKLCKEFIINNLHVLEDAKRRRGQVGPLSRTLGKRRLVLPKKFEDFALSAADEVKLREEENKLKAAKAASLLTMSNATTSNKPASLATTLANSAAPSTPVNKTVAAPKIIVPASALTPFASKATSVANKSATLATSKSTVNTTNKTTALSSNKTTVSVAKQSPVVTKSSTVVTSVVATASTNKPRQVTPNVAKIRTEVPPKKSAEDPQPTVDSLVMDWSDSDKSAHELPLAKEQTKLPYKHFSWQKMGPQAKELSEAKTTDSPISATTITKSRSSMTVTKTALPKTSAQSSILQTSAPATKTVQSQQKGSKPITSSNPATPVSHHYRHLCGICNKELHSKKEAEAHVLSHKISSNQLNVSPVTTALKVMASAPASKAVVPSKAAVATPTPSKPAAVSMQMATSKPTPSNKSLSQPTPSSQSTPPTPSSQSQPSKPKLMRCKRCQAIVEAEQVKSHVCNSVKFNCTICDCRFGAKHLLDTHMESTHQNKSSTPTQPSRQAKSSPGKDKQRLILIQENNDSKNSQPEDNLESILSGKSSSRSEGYSCFVCDKIFDDEVQMKEHLYMHSDEVSDDGDDKGFPCAFCYEKFQTEESLEAHVDIHLKDDGDEKINMLINLNTNRRERKRTLFRCEVCSDLFSSAMLLAMHMQSHEEEEAEMQEEAGRADAAEAAEQEDEPEPYVCTICDQIFESAEELSEHHDMHNGNAHVCILCEKPFSSIRDLQEHVSTHL